MVFFVLLRVTFCFLFFIGCNPKKITLPKAVQGVLDISDLPPKTDTVNLDGQWEFYPNEFISVEKKEFSSNNKPIYLTVPGNWNKYFQGPNGYGTYRLVVKLPNAWDFPIAIKSFEQGTAYDFFINGQEYGKGGVVGRSLLESVPEAKPFISKVIPSTETIEIIVHVSNFHFREGGLWYSILLGKEDVLLLERERDINLDMFLLGSILIMGVYHTVLYFIRKKDKSPLWFGLFCFDIIFRLLSFNEKYINTLIPGIPYQWATRIEYWAYYFAVPLFAQFLYSIYPNDFSKKILKLIWTVSIIFISLVLFTGSSVFTHSAPYFHICTFLSASYFLYIIGYSLFKKRESAIMLFLGTGVIIAGTINDILFSMGFIHSFYIVPQSLLIFIFIQSVLLSMRFSKAFIENEKLALSLFELNESLEKKIIERTLKYRKEKDKAEQSNQTKDKFVAIISHDLRTPMIGVSNLLEILKSKKYLQDEIERQNLVETCYDTVQHSLAMIKQLLNFSRIETGTLKLKYEEVKFSEYIELILADSIIQAKLKEIKIEITIEPSGIFSIDPEIFSHALKNLISNSIKFTNLKGTILVKAFSYGDFFQIEIQDNGIGISKEKLNDLFKPEKVKSRIGTQGEAGYGMGLFICKYIIEAHKGEIYFNSQEGKGLHCTILLPLQV